jgi:recombination endonuclease VII
MSYNKEYHREYARTEKRQATVRRYNQSENGKKKNHASMLRWRANNREKWLKSMKKTDLKRRYGLTPEAYDAMFERQGRKCAVCSSSYPGRRNGQWCVDHDHNLGRPNARAIVCNGCNLILGHAKDDPNRLRLCMEYLERGAPHPCPH